MKRKDKEPLKLQTEDTKSSLKLQDDITDKQQSRDLNKQGEELIQRDEVENTPFIIITINNESFGTFGKYRITEMYHTKQQCRAELLKMDWNNVVKIMTLVFEILTNKTN
ncbi:MAG: hypothetical protein [Microviridae sp.]|nr:MAG: hypothetical protein [Microviridae sp.]